MPCRRGHESPRDRDGHCTQCRRERQRTPQFLYTQYKYRRDLRTARDEALIRRLIDQWL